jgi:DNA-3-methyladenine glycosylase I
MKKKRCPWPGDNALMIAYHDTQWGAPTHDDKKHFEFLILEAAQAGLSWRTVLNKREGYRRAFAGFDPKKVAKFDAKKIEQLLQNPAIIRNRLKVESGVNNAKRFLEVQKEFGSFSAYCWGFVGGKPKVNKWKKLGQIPATSADSDAFSKDLKKRGFKFVGSTVIYSHMQATGMVNDHLTTCFRHRACQKGL